MKAIGYFCVGSKSRASDEVAVDRLAVPARERELLGLADRDVAQPGRVQAGEPAASRPPAERTGRLGRRASRGCRRRCRRPPSACATCPWPTMRRDRSGARYRGRTGHAGRCPRPSTYSVRPSGDQSIASTLRSQPSVSRRVAPSGQPRRIDRQLVRLVARAIHRQVGQQRAVGTERRRPCRSPGSRWSACAAACWHRSASRTGRGRCSRPPRGRRRGR